MVLCKRRIVLPVSHPKKRTRPSQSGTAAVDSPPSLPPVVGEPVTLSSDSPSEEANATPAVPDTSDKPAKPGWEVKKGSTIHRNALKIMAMRMTGIKDKVIAEQLKISVQSVRNYVHQCLKSGLIQPDWLTAKEQLEDILLPLALENIKDAMYDDTRDKKTGFKVRQVTGLEIAKGTLFKDFDKAAEATASNAIQINVVMPPGPEQTVREGAIAGIPAYMDGEEV
jgi:hypothetical protein